MCWAQSFDSLSKQILKDIQLTSAKSPSGKLLDKINSTENTKRAAERTQQVRQTSVLSGAIQPWHEPCCRCLQHHITPAKSPGSIWCKTALDREKCLWSVPLHLTERVVRHHSETRVAKAEAHWATLWKAADIKGQQHSLIKRRFHPYLWLSWCNFQLSCLVHTSHTFCLSLISLSLDPPLCLHPVCFLVLSSFLKSGNTLMSHPLCLSSPSPDWNNHHNPFLSFLLSVFIGRDNPQILTLPLIRPIYLPPGKVEAWGSTPLWTLLPPPAWHLLTALQGSSRWLTTRPTNPETKNRLQMLPWPNPVALKPLNWEKRCQ